MMTKEKRDYHKRIRDLSKVILTTSVTFLTILIAILGFIKDRTIIAEIKWPIYGVILFGFGAFITSLLVLSKQSNKKDLDEINYGDFSLNLQVFFIVIMVAILCVIVYMLTKAATLPITYNSSVIG